MTTLSNYKIDIFAYHLSPTYCMLRGTKRVLEMMVDCFWEVTSYIGIWSEDIIEFDDSHCILIVTQEQLILLLEKLQVLKKEMCSAVREYSVLVTLIGGIQMMKRCIEIAVDEKKHYSTLFYLMPMTQT